MTTPKPTIAFFGATGGCALNTLVLALQKGYKCIALARTPSKLAGLLTKEHSLPQATLDAHLTVVAGSVASPDAVRAVLAHNASRVVSGLGGAPKLRPSLVQPVTLDQPSVCADGARAILAALAALQADGSLATKPVLAVLSTTGLSSKARDVPWLLVPLYHWMLAVPHVDKNVMETLVAAASVEAEAPISGFSIVRASLLTDGAARGADKVRTGWERHPSAETGQDEDQGPGPAVGYTISRADVGGWVFREVVERDDREWVGKCVTITY